MGHCNAGAKSTRRSFETQGLSGPLIQTQGYFVQVRLREARQIGFLGQVLSSEPVGVLVRAALPRTLRITKINSHIGGYAEVLVLRHLRSCTAGS
jgi:hypothetical protein